MKNHIFIASALVFCGAFAMAQEKVISAPPAAMAWSCHCGKKKEPAKTAAKADAKPEGCTKKADAKPENCDKKTDAKADGCGCEKKTDAVPAPVVK